MVAFWPRSLLTLYGERAVATSVMLRGIASFGPRKQLRSDEWLSLSEDPPVAVVAVDERAKITELVDGRRRDDAARADHAGTGAAAVTDDVAHYLPTRVHDAAKLTVYVGRQARVDGVPAYIAVCDLLYREGVAGASVFLGVDGTVRGQRQRARFFSRNVDVPMMIISVGSAREHRTSGAATRRDAASAASHRRADTRVQTRRRTAEPSGRTADGRRPGPTAVAEVDGLHVLGCAVPGSADSPGTDPRAPHITASAQRGHGAAWRLGVPRRSETARRQADSADAARAGDHNRHRPPRPDRAQLRGRRRGHRANMVW